MKYIQSCRNLKGEIYRYELADGNKFISVHKYLDSERLSIGCINIGTGNWESIRKSQYKKIINAIPKTVIAVDCLRSCKLALLIRDQYF